VHIAHCTLNVERCMSSGVAFICFQHAANSFASSWKAVLLVVLHCFDSSGRLCQKCFGSQPRSDYQVFASVCAAWLPGHECMRVCTRMCVLCKSN